MILVDEFYAYATNMIDVKGIYPFPGMAVNQAGGMQIAALCEPDLAFKWFWDQITLHQAKECIIGLDRTTREGQGTEFADVLTCVHWAEAEDKKWSESFRIGVINYQHEPRIVRPFDFENEYWSKYMTGEVASCRPPARVVVHIAKKAGDK